MVDHKEWKVNEAFQRALEPRQLGWKLEKLAGRESAMAHSHGPCLSVKADEEGIGQRTEVRTKGRPERIKKR